MSNKKSDENTAAEEAKKKTIQELKEFESKKREADSSLQKKLEEFTNKLSGTEKNALNELLGIEAKPVLDESMNYPDVSVFLKPQQAHLGEEVSIFLKPQQAHTPQDVAVFLKPQQAHSPEAEVHLKPQQAHSPEAGVHLKPQQAHSPEAEVHLKPQQAHSPKDKD